MNRARAARWVPLLILVLVIGFAFARRDALADWVRLYGYDPPKAVTGLADSTQMTAQARHLFYLNHPKVAAKADFALECPRRDEKTVVIGCYKPPQRGIAVLKVDDARLNGIEQVTAAHEMLHAAYDRLSSGSRQELNRELLDFSKTGLKDDRIRQVLEAYPADERVNEMHSIFGTEVSSLTPALEAHYRHYFSDRAKVAQAAQAYTSAFTTRQQQIAKYDTQLTAWKQQINQSTADLSRQRQELNGMRDRMDLLQSGGQIGAYNDMVPVFNDAVDRYNSAAAAARNLIAQYNDTVEKRNAIALEEKGLQREIDSSVPGA